MRAWFDRRLKRRLLAPMLFVCLATGHAAAQTVSNFDSVYTPLTGDGCRTVDTPELGASVNECPGVGGYKLQILTDDGRASVSVVAPDASIYPLEYWSVVTGAFSSLGPRAEWVIERRQHTPIALIVRVNYVDQQNLSAPARKSVLAVARVNETGACVTDVVSAGVNGNVLARRAAREALARECRRTIH